MPLSKTRKTFRHKKHLQMYLYLPRSRALPGLVNNFRESALNIHIFGFVSSRLWKKLESYRMITSMRFNSEIINITTQLKGSKSIFFVRSMNNLTNFIIFNAINVILFIDLKFYSLIHFRNKCFYQVI